MGSKTLLFLFNRKREERNSCYLRGLSYTYTLIRKHGDKLLPYVFMDYCIKHTEGRYEYFNWVQAGRHM